LVMRTDTRLEGEKYLKPEACSLTPPTVGF
jgi:hypothetical protein